MRIRTLLLTTVASLGLASVSAETQIDYHADIAPLLRDYCAGCHNGFDLEGGLSVETFAELQAGGDSDEHVILAPGDPDESYLLQTVLGEAEPVMPPEKEPQLSDEQVALLKRWIAEGAKGPDPDEDLSLLSNLTVPEMAPNGALEAPITAVDISADGTWRATGRYGSVRLERIAGAKKARTLSIPDGKVNEVHFSPDGSKLAVASGITGLKGVALVFEVASGDLLRRIGEESHRDILFDAEFSPDGRLVATAGYDRVIRLWELESGRYLREFPSHNGAVFDLAFSPSGEVLASASGDSTSKIWHVESGRRLDTLNQPQGEQFAIDFTPDGRFIVGVGADNRIRLWRFLSKSEPRINPVVRARFGHEAAIVGMSLSPDGKHLVTTSGDRALKRWTLPDLEPAGVFDTQVDVVSDLASDQAGGFVAVRLDGSEKTFAYTGETAVSGNVAADAPAPKSASTGPKPVGEIRLGETVEGGIAAPGETDPYSFMAKPGETWIFETRAQRNESPLDTQLAILDENGEPVERAVLQAVRDSWLTFRGKDSKTSGDFRVHNWREMELNELLYINGEVVKLWHYPRGPDSGFLVYPGFGARHTYFETTPLAHPLGQPCYIVRAFEPGAQPSPNGLPVYRIYFENDDDATREIGKDSRLTFVAPKDGSYRVVVSDTRGFGGEGYHYELTARKPNPGYSVSVAGKNPKISPGSGRELMFTAQRTDGFEGAITIRPEGLPEDLALPDEIVIEPRQYRAFAALRASGDFDGLTKEESESIRLEAEAEVGGGMVRRDLGSLGEIAAAEPAKVRVEILPVEEHGRRNEDGTLEFVVAQGETITARVVSDRNGFEGRVDFGKEDSGRNLPHGVYVDNIGLNGLMIPEGKNEQTFSITAAPWVPETVRDFHVRTTADGKQTSQTVRIRVRSRGNLAGGE